MLVRYCALSVRPRVATPKNGGHLGSRLPGFTISCWKPRDSTVLRQGGICLHNLYIVCSGYSFGSVRVWESCIYICIYNYVHIIYIYVCVCVCACVYARVYIYVCVCTVYIIVLCVCAPFLLMILGLSENRGYLANDKEIMGRRIISHHFLEASLNSSDTPILLVDCVLSIVGYTPTWPPRLWLRIKVTV